MMVVAETVAVMVHGGTVAVVVAVVKTVLW